MKYREFKEIAQKRPYEPFWVSRYFWRHLTIPGSWICASLGISADQVTLLSLISGVAGALCYCWPTPSMWILGTVLIYGWWVLDHMDGELARYQIKHLRRKPDLAGPYLDLLVHRWVQPLYHICLGIGLMRLTGDWPYVLLGCLAGANFVGFTRTQGDSTLLEAIVSGKVQPANPAISELVDLRQLVPGNNEAEGHISKLRRVINLAKLVKSFFAYPGCMVLLGVVTVLDAILLGMQFPEAWGVSWSAALVYLILLGGLALAQNIAGTWYVTGILRRLP